jgi:hypothetical protein
VAQNLFTVFAAVGFQEVPTSFQLSATPTCTVRQYVGSIDGPNIATEFLLLLLLILEAPGPAVLTENFCVFPKFFQANALIIHQPFEAEGLLNNF